MSSGDQPHRPQSDNGAFVLLIVMLTIAVGILLMGSGAIAAPPVRAIVELLFGWFPFLDRALAQGSVDGPSLLMGLAALVMVCGATHWIGRKVVAQQISSEVVVNQRWTWRSTVAVTCGLVVLFAAGIAVVGVGHQAVWLVSESRVSAIKANGPSWSQPSGPLNIIAAARRGAWRTQSRNHLKMFTLAMHNYHDTYSQFPPGAIMLSDGRGYRGWVAALGPFSSVSDEWGMHFPHQAWDAPDVAKYGKGAVPYYVNPELGMNGQFDEHGFAYMHYAGNVHIFPNNRGMRLNDITDGTSTTLAIGEVAENFQPWASPWNRRDPADGINDVPWGFGGPPAANGAYFTFVDGSVREISRNIDRQVLTALGTPSGNDQAVVRDWAKQNGLP